MGMQHAAGLNSGYNAQELNKISDFASKANQ
jgi:hypothetical protein